MTHPMLTWFEGCLDAEEQVAQAALEPWRRTVRRKGAQWPERPATDEDGTLIAFHHAFHSPVAVLALIAAHRAILFYHAGSHECSGPDDNCMWIEDDICPTVRALVSGYQHRPGYLPEWGPA